MSYLGQDDPEEIAEVVSRFPAIFSQAVTDWAKFKAGRRYFSDDEAREVVEWFSEFPKLWDLVRPNFVYTRTESGTRLPLTGSLDFANKVDAWTNTLRTEVQVTGLGMPLLIIAGVIIAGLLGLGGVIWAIGYVRKQFNITALIDGVVAGKVPAAVLTTAIEKEAESMSPLAQVGNVLKWGAIAVAVAWLAPKVIGYFGNQKADK
jgi:hypothetical protein